MPNVPSESPKPYENRFAEVTRKSREARARLKESSDIRAAADEQRIIAARVEAAERDRHLDRQSLARDQRSEQEAARETSAMSALEKASAQHGGEAAKADDEA
jgi:hypothetical protein